MTLYALAGGDVTKIDAVTRLTLLEVATFMMYEQDLSVQKSVNIDEHH